MCSTCWNAKTFAEKVLKNGLCTGQEMTVFDLDGLKMAIKEEWSEHKESEFYVFRKALSTKPASSYMIFNVTPSEKVTVHFV
jgi:hypothetical protein